MPAFNSARVEHLLQRTDLERDPGRHATRGGHHSGDLLPGGGPLAEALRSLVGAAMERYAEGLQEIGAPAALPGANYLRFRLGPSQVSIALRARAKQPGKAMGGEAVELLVRDQRDDESQAYERLIDDAMCGDATLFAREDGVEAAWNVVAPALDLDEPVDLYGPGTWGPERASDVAAGEGGWHDPAADGSRDGPVPGSGHEAQRDAT